MLTMILIILILVVFFILKNLKSKNQQLDYTNDTPLHSRGGYMGPLLTGMILGYLLDRHLINEHQYNNWRDLDPNSLRKRLDAEGILTEDEFVEITERAGHYSYESAYRDQFSGNVEHGDFDGFDDDSFDC